MRVIALVLAACAPFPSLPDHGACVTGDLVPHGRYAYYTVSLQGRRLDDDELHDRLLANRASAPLERSAHRWHVASLAPFVVIPLTILAGLYVLPKAGTSEQAAAEIAIPVVPSIALAIVAQVRGDDANFRAIEAYAASARDRCPP
jgi:hypothetical protein